jgi:shikimate kinase
LNRTGDESTHILVTGAMGAGKTTVGRLLSTALGIPFHDSDETLERRAGETGAEIAERDGVPRLHELELEVFLDLCATMPRSIIAPAASVVDHESGRAAMVANTTIWLTASDDVLAARTSDGDDHRRGVTTAERAALRLRRDPWLERVSSLKVDTSSLSPAETIERILSLL